MYIKRFYRKELPEVEDSVIVKITSENEYGYTCVLLEYDNIEGFISMTELVNTRYVKKHILKVDEIVPTVVLKIDCKNKIIELSRKRIKEADKSNVLSKYRTCSNINRLLNECYIMHMKYCDLLDTLVDKLDVIDLMDNTVWKLYENNQLYDNNMDDNNNMDNNMDDTNNDNMDDNNNIKVYDKVFRDILEDLNLILPNELFEEEFINKAKDTIKKRIVKNNTISEVNFTLLITDENALSKIKNVLDLSNMNTFSENKVNLIIMSPPHYKLRVEGSNEEKVMDTIESIKEFLCDKMKEYSGVIQFDNVRIVSESSYEVKFLGNVDLERLSF